jgi:hypothetical protein
MEDKKPSFDFSDFFGLGKASDKFIEVLSKGIGRLAKAHFIKKDAEANAYKVKQLSEAYADHIKRMAQAVKESQLGTSSIEASSFGISVKSIDGLPSVPEIQKMLQDGVLLDSINERIGFQELKKQVNIQNVTAIAAEQLVENSKVNDEPVKEEWLNRFFNIVEEISDEELQKLWGKILAGEIRTPQKFSIRTLDVVKNLDKDEANLIVDMRKYYIMDIYGYTIFKDINSVPFGRLSRLIELGIINPSPGLKQHEVYEKELRFSFNKYIVFVNKKSNVSKGMVSYIGYMFTKAGHDISELLELTDTPFEYMEAFARTINNHELDITYAKVFDKNDNVLDLGEEVRIPFNFQNSF